jgi:hypothetical protein
VTAAVVVSAVPPYRHNATAGISASFALPRPQHDPPQPRSRKSVGGLTEGQGRGLIAEHSVNGEARMLPLYAARIALVPQMAVWPAGACSCS